MPATKREESRLPLVKLVQHSSSGSSHTAPTAQSKPLRKENATFLIPPSPQIVPAFNFCK